LSEQRGVTCEKMRSRQETTGTAVTRLAVSLETGHACSDMLIVAGCHAAKKLTVSSTVYSNLTSHITIASRGAKRRQSGDEMPLPPFC
jgi:hypothetical protein